MRRRGDGACLSESKRKLRIKREKAKPKDCVLQHKKRIIAVVRTRRGATAKRKWSESGTPSHFCGKQSHFCGTPSHFSRRRHTKDTFTSGISPHNYNIAYRAPAAPPVASTTARKSPTAFLSAPDGSNLRIFWLFHHLFVILHLDRITTSHDSHNDETLRPCDDGRPTDGFLCRRKQEERLV